MPVWSVLSMWIIITNSQLFDNYYYYFIVIINSQNRNILIYLLTFYTE